MEIPQIRQFFIEHFGACNTFCISLQSPRQAQSLGVYLSVARGLSYERLKRRMKMLELLDLFQMQSN
jgi:hypothetical protein